jgi:hypothetical protein
VTVIYHTVIYPVMTVMKSCDGGKTVDV